MSSSASHGPDPGQALIRISPARVHTQVTQTVRYRPVRSLLLLGLLVVVSLFVLFTLSQMAVVQHTMMAQLVEPGRAGAAGVGVGTATGSGGAGGGRAGRAPHRPWRSQFNQFKIEPLLVRNAPSVEVNTALAGNRRRASQVAAIIVRNSILVTHARPYNASTHTTARASGVDASPPTHAHTTPSQPTHDHITHSPLHPQAHITAHTAHATAHINHVNPHKNHVTAHRVHSTAHTTHVIAHTAHVTAHTKSNTTHTTRVISHTTHTPRTTTHTPYPTHITHTPHTTTHTPYPTHITHSTTNSAQTSSHASLRETNPASGQAEPQSTRSRRRHPVEKSDKPGLNSKVESPRDREKDVWVSDEKARHNTGDKVSHNTGDKVRHNTEEEMRHNTIKNRSITTSARSNASVGHHQVSDSAGTLRERDDAARRRFLSKARCETADQDCDNLIGAYQNILLGSKHRQAPVHTAAADTRNISARVAPQPGTTATNDVQLPYKHSNVSRTKSETEGENEEIKANTKLSDLLGTEFSEAEKEFEPLYLREDDDYDLIDDVPTSAPPEGVMATSKATTTVPHLTQEQLRNLPLCPEIPPGLLGHLDIDLDQLEKLQLEDVLIQLEWVSSGGRWSPVQEQEAPCLPRHKVAVVLPYRDRLHHLIILLSWLHPILRRQQLEYTIYVAEQAGNATFNKGSIMNAGFMEAWQRSDANCFVFHDVDLLPEDDRNMYSCPPQPRHLSVGVDTLAYKLPYFLLVGGVLSVRGDQFLRLNGYSNMYWGWGGEDDDMGYRIKQSGLSITRPPHILARYTMIRHLKRRPLTWKVRGKLLRTSGRRYRLDGLNTLRYTLLALHRHPLFTHLLLDVGNPPENLVRLDAH